MCLISDCSVVRVKLMPLFATGQVQVEGSPVKVQLMDTAGQVRSSNYHVFISNLSVFVFVSTIHNFGV